MFSNIFRTSNKSKNYQFSSLARSFKIIVIYCLPMECSLKWCSAQNEKPLACKEITHTVKCVSSRGVPHVPCSIFLMDVCNAQKCWSETCHRHSISTGGSEVEQMPEQSFRSVSLGPWCTFDRQTGREEGSGLRTMLVNSATKACPCWEHLIWMSLSHINCSFFDPSQIHPV